MATTTAAKKKTLAEALVTFQANAPHIALTGENPHFGSKFAALPGVMSSVRAPLAEAGLAVMQFPTTLDGQPALRTVLLHESGEQMEDTMLLAIDKPGPQAQGSALTYARRYSVLAILGLVGDDDDDGNQAQSAAEKQAATFTAPQPKNGKLTPEQEARLTELTASLLAGGHITQEQLDSAAAGSTPADLLARLERYSEQVAA